MTFPPSSDFGLVFDCGFDAAFVIERASRRVIAANDRCQDVMGYRRDELLGRAAETLIPRDSALGRDVGILAHAGHYEEVTLTRGDGDPFHAELTIAHVDHPAIGPVAVCIARDATERRELERELLAKHSALHAAHAELQATVAALRATQRELEARTQEVSALAGQVARVGWRATVSELAADVAHHLNNPVAALTSTLKTLSIRLAEVPPAGPDQLDGLIQRARGAAARIEEHVAAVARVQRAGALDGAPRRLDLANELDTALTMLGRRPTVIEVRRRYPRALLAFAPHEPLHYVLACVLDVAAAAMPNRGLLEVAVERRDRWWVVAVIDHGGGLDPTAVQSLFDPVVGARPGSGLALATAQRLARCWGGDVTYHPRDDGGGFEISIPVETHP